jgi:hypothetical protein
MVHGNFYSVQYEIHLTKQLDLYNDILPICSSIRCMLTYVNNKIILISRNQLDNRYTKKPMATSYACALDTIEYEYNNKIFTREKEPTMFEYKDVWTYANKIKNQDTPIIISTVELDKLNNRLKEIQNIYDNQTCVEPKPNFSELSLEYNQIVQTIQCQFVLANPEYYEKIISIEQELTNIELTQEEIDLIKSVETHPTLAGLIKFSGCTLVNGCY